MFTFCVKLDGNVVDRNCFCSAVEDDIEAVPLIDGMFYFVVSCYMCYILFEGQVVSCRSLIPMLCC